MNLTQFGRVELDPTRVPIPASAEARSEPSFRERLETVSETPERKPHPQPRRDPTEEPQIDSPDTIRERPPAETSQAEAADRSDVSRAQPLPYRADRGSGQEETFVSERSAAQLDRGRTPAEIPVVHRENPASINAQQPAASGSQVATDTELIARGTSTAQAQRNGQVDAKAPAEGGRPPRANFSAERTQPGYRTINKATVQMAEAARDSVFRQIAMRINGQGGEMRVLLDPPEIGQLDLHMVVEKGGTVHLSLIAERPELALILEKHMAELKQTLQVQGLSIGNTEVRAQREGTRNPGRPDELTHRNTESEEGDDLSPAGLRRAGYITAEGLDFWV